MAYHSNGQQGGGGGGSLRGGGGGGGGGGVGLSSGNRSGGPGSIGADYSGDERDSRSGIGGGGGGVGGIDDRIEHDLGDKPIYVLEHLATFTVNKESGIVYPADGMRRLLHLEKTTGIWSQKMQLCLDRQWILIMDYETGNIIERFPASMIQDPTPFTSNGPMEMYNNILVFIVAGGSGSRSEMHIFQCQSISAVHLAEDLKQLRNGKILTQHREIIQQQQQQSPSHQQQQQQQQQLKTFHQQQQQQQHLQQNETDSEIGGINDETSSTSSEKYERDVTVLNHCFDDIEKFIARLQHAAAASRELERRRRNRKSKKKDPGEGLLTLRTKPPHEKEFIDIFAKFKLSFNLLAKLKAHIHDPNAPELVHFLFTPLALIVDASHDTYYDPNLPARVINPLLTREAINLLINCVTSKETELWRSLGDAWTIPRDQWKGGNAMSAYHPVFFDGWSPDYPVIDDYIMDGGNNSVMMLAAPIGSQQQPAGGGGGGSPVTPTPNLKRRIDPTAMHQHQHHLHQHQHQHQQQQQQQHPIQDYDYDTQIMGGAGGQQQQQPTMATTHRSPGSPGLRDYSARSDISIDSIERNGGGGGGGVGGGGVMTHHHLHNIQHHHHQSMGNDGGAIQNNNNNNILPMNSDPMAVGATNNNNNNNNTTTTDLWLDDLQARGAKVVQVTYPRTANNDKELTVQRGEYLEILDDSRKWWKARNSRGQIAHVPHTIVTICNDTNDVFNNPLYQQQQQQNYNKNINRQESGVSDRYPPSSIENNSIGGGGGAGVLPPTAPADWVRNKHIAQRNSYGSLSSDDGTGGDIHHVREDYDNDLMGGDSNRMMIIAGTPATANTTSIYRKHPQPPAPQQRQSTAAIIHTRPISMSSGNNAAAILTNGNNNINHHNNNNNNNINNAPPPPPPPPPLLTPVTPIPYRSASKNNTASRKSISSQGGGASQDEMQEELKHVLTLFRDKRRTLDIIKTPEIFIQQSSSADEVEQWIRAKGFSDKVVKKLHGLNGNELFALKRPTLEDYCGAEEGKRLASQITIQRNVSGYKTARSSELQAILAKARKKTEEA